MIYLDTSFIAPRYIAEATSEQVEQFLLQLDSEEIAISSWTHVEFASLLSRRLRMQEIHETMAVQMMAMFEYDLRESFHVFIPTVADYDLAVHLLQKPSTGLRAGDALHLAIAYHHQCKFYTLDKPLIKAARYLDLEVETLA